MGSGWLSGSGRLSGSRPLSGSGRLSGSGILGSCPLLSGLGLDGSLLSGLDDPFGPLFFPGPVLTTPESESGSLTSDLIRF